MNGRRIILTMAAALALVAGGTTAGAAISPKGPVDSSGVVHGCYTTNAIKGSHFFVLQNAGTSCPKGTTGIIWNQQGLRRPQGSPGPQGVAGPQGPAGASGWSGQVEATENSTNTGISSVEILSQTGPSVLSVKPVLNSDVMVMIFTGDNLPTDMFPIASPAGNGATGIQTDPDPVFASTATVPNTSFDIDVAGGISGSEIVVFNYFLPSS
jgi:hypothetical protein